MSEKVKGVALDTSGVAPALADSGSVVFPEKID